MGGDVMNMYQTFIIALSIITCGMIIGLSIVRADRYQVIDLAADKAVLNKRTGNIFAVAPDNFESKLKNVHFHSIGNKDLDIFYQ